MTTRQLIPLAIALALCACEEPGSQPPIPAGAVELSLPASRTAPFDSAIYLHRHYSDIEARQRLVIRSVTQWQALWDDIVAGISPKPSLPPVDFTREMVVFTGMGVRNTGGYSITIPAAFEHEGTVYVAVHEVSPERSCLLTQALTSPVAARLLPIRSGEVVFSELASIHRC